MAVAENYVETGIVSVVLPPSGQRYLPYLTPVN